MNAFCSYVFFIFILLYCFTLFFNSYMMKLQLAALILLVTSLVITEAYFLRLHNHVPANSRKRESILEKKRISDSKFEGKFTVKISAIRGIEKPKKTMVLTSAGVTRDDACNGYQEYEIYTGSDFQQ